MTTYQVVFLQIEVFKITTASSVTKRVAECQIDKGLKRIHKLAISGLIDEDIDYTKGIYRSSLSQWKKRFPKNEKAIIDVRNKQTKRWSTAHCVYLDSTDAKIQ